jgi:hypothetical protein
MQIDMEKWKNDLIGHWGHPSDILNRTLVSDLKDRSDFNMLPLPVRMRSGKGIASGLVEVKPMSAPTGMLFYMDTVLIYTGEEQIERDAEKWMRKNIELVTIRTK